MSHVSLCLRIFPNQQTKKSGWNRKFWSEIWSIENKRLFMLLYVFIWRNLHHLSEWMTWCPRMVGHFCRWGNESENLAGCPGTSEGHLFGRFLHFFDLWCWFSCRCYSKAALLGTSIWPELLWWLCLLGGKTQPQFIFVMLEDVQPLQPCSPGLCGLHT